MRSNIEDATWTRRLAYDIGAVTPTVVPVAAPVALTPSARHHRDGFQVLLSLRWWDHAPRSVAWTVRFSAAWCGSSHREAHRALRELIDTDVIVEDSQSGIGVRAIRYYLPGPIDGGDCR